MDERTLHGMRREPRPEFARELHERLRRQGPALAPFRARPALRLGWSLAGSVAVALAVLGFTVPAVRVSAQAFLDLFRVRNFAAVSVDPARLERLRERKLDPASLLAGGQPEVLESPAPPRVVGSAGAAAAAVGFAVRVPAALPAGLKADTITVLGGGAARFAVDGARLREMLETLDLRDLEVPDGLDGRPITVRTFPMVRQCFTGGRGRVELVQTRSPEVSLPEGLDLARLGEIGLRVAGLDAGEARRFARAIDWHSTLVVPVPLDAASFTEVSVHGQRGLLVGSSGQAGGAGRASRHPGHMLLWSEDGMVFALGGKLDEVPMIEMAESLR
jgi:hypothetical protein